MRLARYADRGRLLAGFWFEDIVIDVAAAIERVSGVRPSHLTVRPDDTLGYLPHGAYASEARAAWEQLSTSELLRAELGRRVDLVDLVHPFPVPRKLLLLAGNYAEHVRERGDVAREREKTFPYVFIKPGSTTLNHPGADIVLPAVSPTRIDWEVELAVLIGRTARRVDESEALEYVAGYTVVNDISDRGFRPCPGREERKRDAFFDWLHGKWHDGFCPAGPCVLSSEACPDPQALELELRVNGSVRQHASTSEMIFPVAAVIAFISSFVTLEPGDVISTGTPSGVGHARGEFLRPGDRMEASIAGIGVLRNRVVAEGEASGD
jgi:2,4-diketo-3-deoxy-L-fuconate hydrolase